MLETADVRPIEFDVVSELLLRRPTSLVAQFPESTAEGTAMLGDRQVSNVSLR